MIRTDPTWEMNISNELESLQATESRQGYVSERERARIDELVAKKPTTERYESISDAVADGHLVAPVRIIVDGSPVYVQLDIEQLSGKLKGCYRGATKTQFYNPVTGVEGEASITVMDGKEATPKIAWTRTIPSVGERFWTTADYAEGILDRSPEQGYVPGVRPEEVRVAAGSPGIYKKHNGRWTYVNDPTERKTFVRQLVSEGLPVPRAVMEEYQSEPWAKKALSKLEAAPVAGEGRQPMLVCEFTDDFTKGPWSAGQGFVTAGHKAICKMSHDSAINYAASPGSVEDAANARLIAAAPDLLNAVRDAADYFHDFIESDQQETELAAALRAVIKKAVGGAA